MRRIFLFLWAAGALSGCIERHENAAEPERIAAERSPELGVSEASRPAQAFAERRLLSKDIHSVPEKTVVQVDSFEALLALPELSFRPGVPQRLPEGFTVMEIFAEPDAVRIRIEQDAGDLAVEAGEGMLLQSSKELAAKAEPPRDSGETAIAGGTAAWHAYGEGEIVLSWEREGVFYRLQAIRISLEDCVEIANSFEADPVDRLR